MDTLFGIERPAALCEARIEIKLPSVTGPAGPGRPIKVWSGPSDSDEAQVHTVICKNEVLNRIARDRELLEGGHCVLKGRLVFWDAAQEIGKYDIEVVFIPLGKNERKDESLDLFQKIYEMYARTLTDMKSSYDNSLSKLGEHYSQGLGKVSEAASVLGELAGKIHEDRINLNTALLAQVKSTNQAKPESLIDQVVKFGSFAKGVAELLQTTKLGANGSSPETLGSLGSEKPKGGL